VPVEIRGAQPVDLPGILELIEGLEELQDPWRVFPPRSSLIGEVRSRYAAAVDAPSDEHLWVAVEDGSVVGTAYAHVLVPSTVSDEPAVELAGVFVRPDHRGRGIARALTARAARFARARAVRRLTVKVFAQNEDGLRLWEALGFQPRMLQMTALADRFLDRDEIEPA
jgi:GNAT superfamily N-acetyltransferase